MLHKSKKHKKASLTMSLLAISALFAPIILGAEVAWAQYRKAPAKPAPSGVYPEYRSRFGTIRWVSDQMPLKVYISPGLTLDSIIDPSLGVPIANTDNLAAWPNLVANVLSNPEQFQALKRADGYVDGHYQAALEGVLSWKQFEREGLFSYELTQDPGDADIYVFFTNHFVGKSGMALFAQDIRGYTSKTNFPYKAILAGGQADFKPAVIVLRTTDGQGQPMSLGKLKAAATHEFGHALGIEGHSTNPVDLMSAYYGRGVISPNDAATIRHLYRLTPDLIP
ncbi:MAG: matrixin family metalloprotease [Candidatus Melainabacteria bacterium]|nr:matrixin family metalloprotease [Candidatus Melainabacteria bacterium]